MNPLRMLSIVLAIPGGAVAADIDFLSPHAAYATGSGPRTVTVGRLDDNASNDVVVGNMTANSISVLLNQGSGTFAPKTDYAVPGNPSSVAIIDLDGDGKNDVVVANQITAGCISVFLGTGDGTLQARTDFAASSPLVAMRVVDVDADGEIDVIATGTGIDFFKGDGTGGFAAPVRLLSTGYTNSVTVGDLDGDNKVDIACTRQSILTTLFGNGDGTFGTPVTHDTGAADLSVGMGDFNGDGKNDLAETHYYGPAYAIAVLLNQGDGSFGPPATFATGAGPKSLMVADLDADGHQDLICVNSASYTLGILRGIGDGTFHPHIGHLTGSGPYVDAVGDLDGNGSLDLVTANLSSNNATVLLQGSGSAPNAITSLSVGSISDQYARLSWTTPLVESYGAATRYDLRIMTGNMTPGDFATATPVVPGPVVGRSGSAASFVLSGLTPATTYSVAMTTTDAFGRTSPLSVIVGFTTAASDVLPPNTPSPYVYRSGNNSCELRWTAPGDDGSLGRAASYDLRMSLSPIVDDTTFAAATPVATGTPGASGAQESAFITGLASNATYYFALIASDEVPQASARGTTSVQTSANDTTAPGQVTDLQAVDITPLNATMRWTATGDDDSWGKATHVELRYATTLFDATTFQSLGILTPVTLWPAMAGTTQEGLADCLIPATTYHVAIVLVDDAGNRGPLSNIVTITTPEGTPPGAITDLAVTGATATTLTLSWTAPGDDDVVGTATAYDLRYSTSPITDLTTFLAATPATGIAAPQVAGSSEQFTLTGLSAATTYHVAVRTADEVPNHSILSNGVSGTTNSTGGSGSGGAGGGSGGTCGIGSGLATLLLLGGFLLLGVVRTRP